jgi:hypothetical protein
LKWYHSYPFLALLYEACLDIDGTMLT